MEVRGLCSWTGIGVEGEHLPWSISAVKRLVGPSLSNLTWQLNSCHIFKSPSLPLLSFHSIRFNKRVAEMDWRPTKATSAISRLHCYITNLQELADYVSSLLTICESCCEAKMFFIYSIPLEVFAFPQPV